MSSTNFIYSVFSVWQALGGRPQISRTWLGHSLCPQEEDSRVRLFVSCTGFMMWNGFNPQRLGNVAGIRQPPLFLTWSHGGGKHCAPEKEAIMCFMGTLAALFENSAVESPFILFMIVQSGSFWADVTCSLGFVQRCVIWFCWLWSTNLQFFQLSITKGT